MAHEIAVLAFAGISPFRLGVPSAVFAETGVSAPRLPYVLTTVAEHPGLLPTAGGYDIRVTSGLSHLAAADTVIIPSWDPDTAPSAELVDALVDAHERGARLVGLCLGSFLLAAAGLLDHREATTHWSATARLATQFPAVTVRSDVLWCDGGDVVTSAGSAAALDCCLHLLRSDLGADVAAAKARSLVLAPHRGGSQAQYVPVPVVADTDDAIGRAITWAVGRLDQPITLDDVAAQSHLSRRTFTRRFRDRTGSSFAAWLTGQRLDRARVLLETTDASIEQVAVRAGFGTSATMRQQFAARLHTTPRAHRAAFSGAAAAAPARPAPPRG